MDKELLRTIQKKLPRGYLKILMERTDRSEPHIINVFAAKTEDPHVIEEALNLIKEVENNRKRLERKAKRILKKDQNNQ
jgi:hypothetical protein